MRTDAVRLRAAARAHRAAADRAARCGAAAGGAAGADAGTRRPHACATCRTCCAPGDALVVNDTKVIPARLFGRRIGRGSEPRIEATLHKRLDGSRWRAFVKPAKRLAAGRRHPLRRRGQGLLPRPARCDGRGEGRGRRGDAVLRVSRRRCSTRRSPNAATCRCRPISPAAPHAGRTRPRRLSDHVRPRGRLGRGADRRPAFHRCAGAAAWRARHRPAQGDAACRRRHLPAGQERRHRGPRMHAEWGSVERGNGRRRSTRRARAGGRIVAVGSTALRLLESAADEDGVVRAFSRRDRDLHHARLSLPRRRR